MKIDNLTVDIGIIAYNEENNIRKLLLSLISQSRKGFNLRNIIVITDGCTDQTISEIKKVKDSQIQFINGKTRKGKVKRLNEVFTYAKSNVLVLFDADVVLADKFVVKKLVTPILKDRKVSLVNGNHYPLSPIDYIEKLAYFGVELWNEAIRLLGSEAERYYVTGQIRALSRHFYKDFRLPLQISSSEDVYIFYYAKKMKLKVVSVLNAVVFFRLSSTLSDYSKQMKRFIKTSSIMDKSFTKELVSKYEKMSGLVKLWAIWNLFFIRPLNITVPYFLIQFFVKLTSKFYSEKLIWDVSASTKKVNYEK
jgi:glycosyltransferase involved in cell wall biosynthesis